MIDKRNLPKPDRPIDLRRPEDWAIIEWNENLSCFRVGITAPARPPQVGYHEYSFDLQPSDVTELRDALTQALKVAGIKA
jgi:hypothetical protein